MHSPVNCPNFKDYASRRQVQKDKGLCVCCLREDCRDRSTCKSAARFCQFCGKTGHHPALCLQRGSYGGPPPKPTGDKGRGGGTSSSLTTVSTPDEMTNTVAVAHGEPVDYTDVALLPTALIHAKNLSGTKAVQGRALFDTGSCRTFVTEALCRKLALQNVGSAFISVGRFGTNSRSNKVVKRVRFNVLCDNGCLLYTSDAADD